MARFFAPLEWGFEVKGAQAKQPPVLGRLAWARGEGGLTSRRLAPRPRAGAFGFAGTWPRPLDPERRWMTGWKTECEPDSETGREAVGGRGAFKTPLIEPSRVMATIRGR